MRRLLLPLVIAGAFVLTACNQAKSPDEVAKDVANAEQKSASEVARSEDVAANSLDRAAGNVDGDLVTFSNDAAREAYNIAVTKADGDRKVALAACESQSGDAQKNCKDQAEADYKAAKANAKAQAESAKH